MEKKHIAIIWLLSFFFFYWLLGCASVPPEEKEPRLCRGFYIEFHSREQYPIVPEELLRSMAQHCFDAYNGDCLAKITQRPTSDSWWVICKKE